MSTLFRMSTLTRMSTLYHLTMHYALSPLSMTALSHVVNGIDHLTWPTIIVHGQFRGSTPILHGQFSGELTCSECLPALPLSIIRYINIYVYIYIYIYTFRYACQLESRLFVNVHKIANGLTIENGKSSGFDPLDISRYAELVCVCHVPNNQLYSHFLCLNQWSAHCL